VARSRGVVVAVMKKNLRGGSDEILRETYQLTAGEIAQTPTPSLAVIRSGLDILSLQYPQAKQA
jgi:hypothetical protein